MTSSERREREKAQRRQEILDAARQVFFERGFHRPTMDDVAAQAEISKGTIYLYFESKETVLAHLLLEGLDLLLVELESAQQRAHDAKPPLCPEATLRALTNAYLTFCQSQPNYFRLLVAFDRGRFEELIPPELYKEVLGKSLQGLNLVAQAIEQGKETGLFVAEDSWRAAGSVWAALNGVLVLMGHPLRRKMLKNNAETMYQSTLNLIITGLKGQQPKEGDG
ncbi:MAG: TetR/AcrR family transcriptional regulator [Thermoflexales bacterium]|nr:TetR/AcrR family transcriptional regulator [Thermoflexales bacterium]